MSAYIPGAAPINSPVDLQRWMEGLFSPTVLVRTSPSVESICMKNGLHFIDLLRPYQTTRQCKWIPSSVTNPNSELFNYHPAKLFR